jgi:hypothetical protein
MAATRPPDRGELASVYCERGRGIKAVAPCRALIYNRCGEGVMNQDIVRQLERVERSNRRLRLALATLFLGITIVVTMAAAKRGKKEIRAQSFVLVDDEGNMLAKLGKYSPQGSGGAREDIIGLILFAGEVSVDPVGLFGYYPEGFYDNDTIIPFIGIKPPGKEVPGISLMVTNDYLSADLSIESEDGLIELGVDNNGPKLTLTDKDGKTLFEKP